MIKQIDEDDLRLAGFSKDAEKKKCNFIVSNNNQGYFNIPSFGFLQIACIKESPQIKSLFFSIKEIENPVYQLKVQKNSLLNVKFR